MFADITSFVPFSFKSSFSLIISSDTSLSDATFRNLGQVEIKLVTMKECFICLCCLLLLLSTTVQANSEKQDYYKQCYGTSDGLAFSEVHRDYLDSYTNCTHILGNLELTHLTTGNGASFKNIREVTGYVIISASEISAIDLSSLQVIRGTSLFQGNYSLYIYKVDAQKSKDLRMRNLTEIQNGRIYISNTMDTCYLSTIDWSDISKSNDSVDYQLGNTNCSDLRFKKCHANCEDRGCWGPGENSCQKNSTYVTCHEKCKRHGLRCRGAGEDDCCNSECTAGCTGSTNRDCKACKNIFYDGECKETCPKTGTKIQNNDHLAKSSTNFELGGRCVESCPDHFLIQEGKCVTACEMNVFEDNDNGRCIHCAPNCRSVCGGVGNPEGKLAMAETINASNIHVLEGCTEINGNLIFLHHVFNGKNGITLDTLRKTFKNLRVVTGFLKIIGWPQTATSLDAFENLEEIKGYNLEGTQYSLRIQDNPIAANAQMTQISALGLRSLRRIKYGNVGIWNLPNLCYWHLDWTSIFGGKQTNQTVVNDKKQAQLLKSSICFNQNCSKSCKFCAGPREEQCTKCQYYEHNHSCYDTCPTSQSVYNNPENFTCDRCHALCSECYGPGVAGCSQCKYYNNTETGECVRECPLHSYGNDRNKTCEHCSPKCKQQANKKTCVGASAIYLRGCHRCYTARQTSRSDGWYECEMRNYTCPDGYYSEKPKEEFDVEEKMCILCPRGCKKCTSSNDCTDSDGYPSYVGAVVAVVTFLFVLLLVLVVYSCWRKRKVNADNSSAVLYPWSDPNAPLVPIGNQSGLAPNQAQLKIVKETELRIGNLLGSGAFGAVHKGYWMPDDLPNNKKVKIPVAIKILKNGPDCGTDSELLKEALFMASCEHPNLVRLLGISVCSRLLLISQLMPLGNLLNYVRINKEKIGSQYLLNWCLQISQGMQYLSEEKHLVHRDLAARNVLVKSPHHVRITDFGLAKLLDVNEDAYRAQGGKMPIKWLALESIQKQLFTQKSDVWSFGVTMWELMTFGKKPYENTPACQIHSLLQRGERLPQPQICTIDIYMILIRCWMVDVSARPTFRELSEELTSMAQEPKRFIVIPEFKDSYSRLPSQSNSEFLRSLLDEEKDGFEIADAEEYLLPQLNSNYMTFPDGNFLLKRGPTQSWEPCAFFNRSTEENVQLHMPDRRLGSATTESTTLPSVSSYPVSQINSVEQNRSSRTDLIQFKRVRPKSPKNNAEVKKNQVWFSAQQLSVEKEGAGSEATVIGKRPRANTITIADMIWEEKASGPSRMSMDREGSVCSARYSADPTQIGQYMSQEYMDHATFNSMDDGYLTPIAASRKMPEYFDLSLPHPTPPSTMTVEDRREINHSPPPPPPPQPPHFRALSNPIYQHAPCVPNRRTTPPSSGYDIPRVCVTADGSVYQNINNAPPPTQPPSTTTNASSKFQLSKSRLHSSVSENRDSGVQTDDEEDDDDGRCSLTGNLKKQTTAVNNPSYTMLPSCGDDDEEDGGGEQAFSSARSETNKLLSKSSSVNFPIVS